MNVEPDEYVEVTMFEIVNRRVDELYEQLKAELMLVVTLVQVGLVDVI